MTSRAGADLPTATPAGADTSGNAELFRGVVSETLVNRGFAEKMRAQILESMILSTRDLLARAVSARVLGGEELEARWDELPGLPADVLLRGRNKEPT